MALGVVCPAAACDGVGDPAAGQKSVTAVAGAGPVSASAPASCQGGTVALAPLTRKVVVTEVSDVIRSTRGKPFTADLRLVRTVVPSVEASEPVDSAAVFAQFAKQAGPAIAPLNEASPREGTSGEFTVDKAGAMVTYESVQEVKASFTYRCGDVAVSGVVRSWGRPRTGIMQCDDSKPPTAEVVREVAALAC